MNKLNTLLFVGIILFVSACKKEISGIKTTDRNKYIQELDFRYFDSNTKIRYQEGEKQVAGNARIRISKDSLIWFSISPPLGFEVTRALITPDTIWILNRMDKEFYVFNYKEISRYFNFDVDYQLIQSIVLGNLPQPLDDASRVAREKNYFMIKQKRGDLNIQSFVNMKNKKLETVVMKEMPSNNTLMLSYEDFQQVSQYLFAHQCQLNLKYTSNQGPIITSLRLQHNRTEITDKPLKFPFTIPKKYEVFD